MAIDLWGCWESQWWVRIDGDFWRRLTLPRFFSAMCKGLWETDTWELSHRSFADGICWVCILFVVAKGKIFLPSGQLDQEINHVANKMQWQTPTIIVLLLVLGSEEWRTRRTCVGDLEVAQGSNVHLSLCWYYLTEYSSYILLIRILDSQKILVNKFILKVLSFQQRTGEQWTWTLLVCSQESASILEPSGRFCRLHLIFPRRNKLNLK